MSDYLTIAEAAEMLRIKESTLRNKMAAGVFREGEHYFRRRGLAPRFKRAALEAWLEGKDEPAPAKIRMAGGYYLGSGR